MTRASSIAVVGLLLVACGGAQRSRWTPNAATDTPYFICKCDGVERQPKPQEAADYRDEERVDLVCEGKVHDCRPGKMRTPGAAAEPGGSKLAMHQRD